MGEVPLHTAAVLLLINLSLSQSLNLLRSSHRSPVGKRRFPPRGHQAGRVGITCPLGPLGSSSSQHRRTPELVLQESHASFRITFRPPCTCEKRHSRT
ncbi:hypothetical protein T484DRAFT_1956065 [Baffinella frigidus]|nr:hypothetical protein T484DRAFT_1956065 [Cryptophyta sp. CCMP2293]